MKQQPTFLTKDRVKELCPVAFYTEPTANVSDKYTFADTSVVMDDLEVLGWKPVKAAMRNRRVDTYSKHMIVFQNEDMVISGADGDDVFPQIILNNSHDATSSFQFRIGLYRLICSNGLVVATAEFSSFRIKHMHYSFDAVRDVVRNSVDALPNHITVMNDMKQIQLNPVQENDLALDALLIRHGIHLSDRNEGKALLTSQTLQEVTRVTRREDQGNDLWKTFNRIQENVLSGSYVYFNGKKERKATPIRSFLADQEFNQKLFQRATELIPA